MIEMVRGLEKQFLEREREREVVCVCVRKKMGLRERERELAFSAQSARTVVSV